MTLSDEWMRLYFSFFDKIYRIKEIFFACGEIPKAEGVSIQIIL